MKPSTSSFTYYPFEEMQALLEARSISLPEDQSRPLPDPEEEPTPETDQVLFIEAMEGVAPISRDNCMERMVSTEPLPDARQSEEAEVLTKLRNLIQYGEGFNVSETPEYIEGTGYNIHPEIARRLHRGDYSIQAHVDLHGLTADAAKAVFEDFLKQAVTTGKSGILVIHGRGLSSPSEPVLKRKVVDWLTRGPWRKWVIAFSSARRCDGGAGATYVLLRKRPVSKRVKIGRKRSPMSRS
jgi:DNA-nicking Smr family endonuclease